jgi:uncharacterized protein
VIVNLTDRRANDSRRGQLNLISSLGPDRILREFSSLAKGSDTTAQSWLPHLAMPDHHEIRAKDVMARRLHGALRAAADRGPEELLLTPGLGARTVLALAMVAEVVHGSPYRFGDPARFAFALGGKDRHPFPVPLRVYDKTIDVLKSAVLKAKIGRFEELAAIERLNAQARGLERYTEGPAVETVMAAENDVSHRYGGGSIFGWAKESAASIERRSGHRRS